MEDRKKTRRREEFQDLWRKLLEIETELRASGREFNLEDQRTWPTYEELGEKVPRIYLKHFRNSGEIVAGQLLAHTDKCDGYNQHHDSSCPGQQCCRIAFESLNYPWSMKRGFPHTSRCSPYMA